MRLHRESVIGLANGRHRAGSARRRLRHPASESALHQAVAARDLDGVVALLMDGADWAEPDRHGRLALSPTLIDPVSMHHVRQRYRRAVGARAAAQRDLGEPCDLADELDRNGIVKVPGLLDTRQLESLSGAMTAFVARVEHEAAQQRAEFDHYDREEHFSPGEQVFTTNNAFRHFPELVDVATSERISTLVRGYAGHESQITRAVGARYLPVPDIGREQFRWHHDMEDRRIKLIVLLTDVDEGGQSMSYLAGSHQLLHPYRRFFDNACEPDYCERALGPITEVRVEGRAGDAFLFDSNGAHRGNRRLGAPTRDALFVEYCPDLGDVWGGDLHPSALGGGSPMLEAFRSTEPKWQRPIERTFSTWVETLYSVDTWLPRSTQLLSH